MEEIDMARRTNRAAAVKQDVTRAVEAEEQEAPELSVVPDEETQEVPVAEEDVSQEVPEGVDPATGEITEPEAEAPVDVETGEALVLPEGMEIAEGVEVTQEVVDAVAVDAAAEFDRIAAEGAETEGMPTKSGAEEEAPAEPAGEPEAPAAVEPPKNETAAQRRARQKKERQARGNVVSLPTKTAKSDAAEPEPVEPSDAAEPVPVEGPEPVMEPETEPVKAPAKAKATRTPRVKREKAVLEGGWPVDTGEEVLAQQRPAKTAMPTGKVNWYRGGETHFVWFFDRPVHGTCWVDISFDRTLRTAELWWTTDSVSAQRHYLEDVSSDEDALKVLGFTPTFPATEAEVVLPEGMGELADLWAAANPKRKRK